MGRDTGGSGGSPAQGCWHMILFLILPLGLSPTLTSDSHLPPSPPSFLLPFSLQCQSQCPVPLPSAEGTPWLALQVMGMVLGRDLCMCQALFNSLCTVHQAPSTLHAGQCQERSTQGTPLQAAPH